MAAGAVSCGRWSYSASSTDFDLKVTGLSPGAIELVPEAEWTGSLEGATEAKEQIPFPLNHVHPPHGARQCVRPWSTRGRSVRAWI
jgi:hypothetical protein